MNTPASFPWHRAASLSVAAALVLSGRALAQITVTTVADENDSPAGAQVSLREALRDSADGAEIWFAAALNGKVLVLTAGEMAVTGKEVAVIAPGGFVIEARGFSRIFNVGAGAELNLIGLTLQGGKAPAGGGAILNAGSMFLKDCVLRDNRAADGALGAHGPTNGTDGNPTGPPGGIGGTGSGGGAVRNTGSLSALRCHITGNAAGTGGTGGTGGYTTNPTTQSRSYGVGGPGGTGGTGGAISSAGPLALAECIFETNWAGPGGTGGNGYQGGSTVSGGTGGSSGNGGAISQASGMTVERCSFVGNWCPSGGEPGYSPSGIKRGGPGSGTAIFWNTGMATLTNCTFTGNGISESAFQQTGERGGSIAAGAGTLLYLAHCTVSGNLVGPASTAAGIVSTAPVQCQNCIISGNMRNQSGTATPNWEENNFSPNTPRTLIPYSLLGLPGVNAQLSALAIAAGTLPVLVPEAGSLALDAGTVVSSPPATDQRGLPRAVGAPDLGAVEVQAVELAPRVWQSITFGPVAMSHPSIFGPGATSSSGLPVSYELISGPATLTGNTLSLTGTGFVAVRATQPGNGATAPALSVVRVIDTARLQYISFTPEQKYTVDIPNARFVDLPPKTSANNNITWSVPAGGGTISSGQLRMTNVGSVQLQGYAPGTATHDPVLVTWILNFVDGALWWDTPPAPGGGLYWFTLVEGSPHGLSMTARINGPRAVPVAVPSITGLTITPSFIPAGQTFVQCMITVPPDPQLTNSSRVVGTGHPGNLSITLFLANRNNVPLNVFAPARVIAGASTRVDVSCPGITASTLLGPPPNLAERSFTVAAFDFDNAAVSIPVTLDSGTPGSGPYPTIHLRLTFPPTNRRVRLKVTTDDGITGQAGPIQILTDTNADGDGISDIVEAALQRAPNLFHPPPLIIEQDATGQYAVLGSRPLNLEGWTVAIELSTDLQTWMPAPVGSTTVTPNPDGITGRVSVLLPADEAKQWARLKVTLPP